MRTARGWLTVASVLACGVAASGLAIVNPMKFARIDAVTAVMVAAATIALCTVIVVWNRRRDLSGRTRALAIAGGVTATVLGLCCTSGVYEFVPTWTVLARSPDGRHALAERVDVALVAGGARSLHLWAGSGAFARDMGELVVYSDDNHEVALNEYRFVDNHTVLAVVGDREHLFAINDRGRPVQRRP
jgi:hypothetical protein